MMLTNQKIEVAIAGLDESEKLKLMSELKDPVFSGQINSVTPARAKDLLKLATCFSIAPISGFYVGAIAVGKSGKLYLGANMEFKGVPLSYQEARIYHWNQNADQMIGLDTR